MAVCDRRIQAVLVVALMMVGCTPNESDTLTPDQVFIKYYGGSAVEVAADFVTNIDATSGLSYVIFGSSNSPEFIDETRSAAENRDFVLLFANKDGNLTDDEKRFYFPDVPSVTSNTPKRLKKTVDGGYIMVGTAIYDGQSDMYVVKTDANGLEQRHWFNASAEVEAANDILEVNGGFIVVGSVGSGADRKFTITKLLESEVEQDEYSVLWEYVGAGVGVAEEAVSILPNNGGNGAVVLVNTRQKNSINPGVPPNGNLRFVGISSTAILQEPVPSFSTVIGDDGLDEVAAGMKNISDNDVYIVGNSTTNGDTDRVPFFMRATGEQLSTLRTIRFDELDPYDMTATNITRTANGNYLMLATGVSDLTNGAQLMLMRLDASGALDAGFGGSVTPFIQYGERGNEIGVSVAQLPDGGLGLLGTMGFDNNANTVIGFIKTNGNGVLGK